MKYIIDMPEGWEPNNCYFCAIAGNCYQERSMTCPLANAKKAEEAEQKPAEEPLAGLVEEMTKYCRDCKWCKFAKYCNQGYKVFIPYPDAASYCSYYVRKWWKFWRPK